VFEVSFFEITAENFQAESCFSMSTRKPAEVMVLLLDFQLRGECHNFTSLKPTLSHAPNASQAIDCCKFKLEMLRKPGSISRNVHGETPFPSPEGYAEMKFNQYLLIFMAVAIMCLYSSVISGGKKPKEENCNCQRKRP